MGRRCRFPLMITSPYYLHHHLAPTVAMGALFVLEYLLSSLF